MTYSAKIHHMNMGMEEGQNPLQEGVTGRAQHN